MDDDYALTLRTMREAVEAGGSAEARLQRAMELIHERHRHCEWVGVYLLRGDMLELGPYVGAPTEHTRIPVGQGVCGTAVAQRANQVIEDVRALDNYLACSTTVRSEIVVLVWHEGEIVGQIDADCDAVGAFTSDDEASLSEIATLLAPVVAEVR